jgi:hypothetical protein
LEIAVVNPHYQCDKEEEEEEKVQKAVSFLADILDFRHDLALFVW